jgi:hypothetical protein
MEKIMLKAVIIGLVVVMSLSLIRFNEVFGDNEFDLLICVEYALVSELSGSLYQYALDLEQEGWTLPAQKFLPVNLTIYNTASYFRTSVLIPFWNNFNISGCVLIGDIPYAVWDDELWGSYATDYYYMDLDGNWTDSNEDGVLDNHTNGTGDIQPEIWVSRLTASTVEGNEVDRLKTYFNKTHTYRNASSRASVVQPRALAYIDNELAINMGSVLDPSPIRSFSEINVNDTINCLGKAYTDVTLVASPILNATNTNTLDYWQHLDTKGYECVWIAGHGGLGCHGFAWALWNEEHGYWYWPQGATEGVVRYTYYLGNAPKSFFYIFLSCHSAEFDKSNCVANSAVFGTSTCLTTIGMTTSADGWFSSWFFEAFDLLRQQKCIGEAYKTIYTHIIDSYEATGRNHTYFIALLGDPTIRINSPPYIPSKPSGDESGYAGRTYSYSANTTDFNGDQIWYQFNWGDATNMTVGPYNSGETGSASHQWVYNRVYNVTVRAKDSHDVWGNWSAALQVNITTPPSSGCPFVYAWNGTDYVIDNNLLAWSAWSNGTEVEDYYKLEQSLAPIYEGDPYSLYSLKLSEFQQEHSHLDQIRFMTVDHDSKISVAISPFGEILTYQNPYAPMSAVDEQGQNQIDLIRHIDDSYYEGYDGSYLLLNFGQVAAENAKLVMRADRPPSKQSIHIQVFNSSENWVDMASIIPRTYWATEIIDLTSYLPTVGDFRVRLYFTDNHKLDFVGLDTTTQAQINVEEAQLLLACHSDDGFVTAKLLNDDDIYAELIPEQQIVLVFVATSRSEEQRTYIVYAKGYYFALDN